MDKSIPGFFLNFKSSGLGKISPFARMGWSWETSWSGYGYNSIEMKISRKNYPVGFGGLVKSKCWRERFRGNLLKKEIWSKKKIWALSQENNKWMQRVSGVAPEEGHIEARKTVITEIKKERIIHEMREQS